MTASCFHGLVSEPADTTVAIPTRIPHLFFADAAIRAVFLCMPVLKVDIGLENANCSLIRPVNTSLSKSRGERSSLSCQCNNLKKNPRVVEIVRINFRAVEMDKDINILKKSTGLRCLSPLDSDRDGMGQPHCHTQLRRLPRLDFDRNVVGRIC